MRSSTFAFSLCCILVLAITGCGGGGAVYEVQEKQKGFLGAIEVAIKAKDQAGAKTACDSVLAKTDLSSQDKTSFERICAKCAAAEWDAATAQAKTMRGGK